MPVSSRIILASRSPRRAWLLRQAGLDVVQIDPPFADPPAPHQAHPDAWALAMDLAASKAQSVLDAGYAFTHADAESLLGAKRQVSEGGTLLLAADTIVIAPAPGCHLLGQPADRAEAAAMLALLIGHSHQVVTGVALVRLPDRRVITFADAAHVTIGSLPALELQTYLNSQAWRGKAGGYNFAELEHIWPITVQGDPTTIIGLPMQALRRRLEELAAEERE